MVNAPGRLSFRPCTLHASSPALQAQYCGQPSWRDANVPGPLSVQSISLGHKPETFDSYLAVIAYLTRRLLDADRHFELGTINLSIHNIFLVEHNGTYKKGHRRLLDTLKIFGP